MKAFLLIGTLLLTGNLAIAQPAHFIYTSNLTAGEYNDPAPADGYTETYLQGTVTRRGSVRYNHLLPFFKTSDQSWVTQVSYDFPFGTPGTNADYFLYQGRNEIQGKSTGGGTIIFDTLYLNNGAGNLFYVNNQASASTAYFNPAAGISIYSRVYFNNGITATNRQYPITGAILFANNADYTGGLTDAQHVDGFVSEANLNIGTPAGHGGNFTFPVGNATSVYQLTRQGSFNDLDNIIIVGWVNGDPEFTSDPTGSINHTSGSYLGAGINAVSRVGFWDWHVQRVNETTVTPRSLPDQQTITVAIPDVSYIPGVSASDLRLVGFNTATSKWENLSGSTGASGLTKGSTLTGIIPAGQTIAALAIGSISSIPLVASNVPGGVGFNTINFWAKADMGLIASGANVTQWINQAPISMIAQPSKTASAHVTVNDGVFNYNPSVAFDGTADEILAGAFSQAPSNPAMLFAVVNKSSATDVQLSNPYSLGGEGAAAIAYQSGSHGFGAGASGAECAVTGDVRNLPSVVRVDYDVANNLSGASTALNGLVTTGSCGSTVVNAADGTFQIGGNTFGGQSGRVFNGQIAELIHYNVNNHPNTTADINKIESYLAIKYGITLDNSANGTLGGNYTSSSGATIWDGSNAAYHHNIIGIGRDDNSGLLQKQSHTTNDSSRIYVATIQTSNTANDGTIGTNGSFVIAGSNEGQLLLTADNTEYPVGFGIEKRVDREWKVTNTNFSGTFSMDFKVVSDPQQIDPNNLRLLVDDDGDFSNATMYSPTIFYVGDAIQVTDINTTLIPAGSTRYITVVQFNQDIVLPVELTSFTARPQGSAVQLNWTTATEQNNSYFAIERSADGTNWQQIGKVAGAGTSTQALSYGYTDQQPLNGTSYYRLKQTNYDGTFTYSPVEIVRLQNGNPSLRVYPNPVSQYVNIQTGKAVTQINLLSTNGRTVLRHAPSNMAGGTFSVNMQSVQSGIYLLQIINKDGTTDVIKLIKQ